ncbi:uncharacterized protein J3R85_019426 [Psidium guajava]|nr:uncharacterized protein J3R85_019426 [Psidium guajava]
MCGCSCASLSWEGWSSACFCSILSLVELLDVDFSVSDASGRVNLLGT